ncbi:MAG: DUF4347 domain-containing protein [Leptolyngbyaceae cyanobacterium SM2_5_2]|nr:DUF4347 domain-containing protein [Leptolyngbyaceae cyanobacterium SM2_5_2]
MSHTSQAVVFIDANVHDLQFLISSVQPGIAIELLAADADGINQITAYLNAHPVETVHIVSHGAPGVLMLGNARLELDNLEHQAPQLKSWFPPEAVQPAILLYGCNVAAGDAGEEFLNKLQSLTRVAISASTTAIGHRELGGNWTLDYRHPGIDFPFDSLAFLPIVVAGYKHLLALPGAHSGTVENEVFIGGNYIELGISGLGDYGTLGTKPEGFFGTNERSNIGMSADFDGFGEGNDLRMDYFLPGTPEERWVVGYKTGDSVFRGSNSALEGPSDIPTSVNNTSTGDTLSAVINSTFNDVLEIDKVVSFDVNDKYFKTQITLTNISDSTLNSVRYMRSFDPDNTVDLGGEYETVNTVIGTIAEDGYAAVEARNLGPGDPVFDGTGSFAPIVLYSNDPRAVASYFGFANTDPYVDEAYNLPPTRGVDYTDDIGITLTFDVGSLAPDTSTSFIFYTSLDNRDFSDVIDDIPDEGGDNNAPTGSVTADGILKPCRTLTANTSTLADADGLGEFSYEWQQSVTGTGGWTTIAEANSSTLTLTEEQIDYYIRPIVRYTDGGDTVEKVFGTPTANPVERVYWPDFAGDGSADIVWHHHQAGQNVLWAMDGTLLDTGVLLQEVEAGWELKAVGNFNDDCNPDLVWRHNSSGQTVLWLMEETFISGGLFLDTVDPTWSVEATGDFNQDQETDILWRHKTSGQNVVWLMEGTERTGVMWLETVESPDWEVGAVGDFTQDGNLEVLWRHRTAGTNVVWFLEGNEIVDSTTLMPVEAGWNMVGTADFTQDGRLDLLWRHGTAGANVLWEMEGLELRDGYVLPAAEAGWAAVV